MFGSMEDNSIYITKEEEGIDVTEVVLQVLHARAN
jgi:hypothetical protein